MHPLIVTLLFFSVAYLFIGIGFIGYSRRRDRKPFQLWEVVKEVGAWPRFMGGLCAFLLVALTVPALAADLIPTHLSPPPPAGLGTLLLQTVFPVVSAFLLGLTSLVLKWVARKYKLDALAKEDSFLMNLAHQGITLAEERAAQLLDSKVPLTGQNKLAIATGHILSVMPKVSETRAQALVESVLAQIPGVGATGSKAYIEPSGQAAR
jgi:hypothetical protein